MWLIEIYQSLFVDFYKETYKTLNGNYFKKEND